MRYRATTIFLASLIVISAAGVRAAQGDKKEDQYYPELQGDDDMRVVQSAKNMIGSGIQYGAWVTPVGIYSETPKSTLATSVTTYRIWFKTYLWDNSYLYLRGKDIYTAVLKERGSGSAKNKNVPDLDLGYIYMGTPTKIFDCSVGRKYFILGSGLVLDGRGDGGEINVYTKYINIKALASYTGWLAKDDNPYGLSDRDISKGARRLFAGGNLSTSWFNQTLYAFGLAQLDFGSEYYNRKMQDISWIVGFDQGKSYYSQKSHYNSQYYGGGLDGTIVSGLSYNGEYIFETGSSYHSRFFAPGSSKTRIKAYAVIAKLTYYIDVILRPTLSFQYAFGSGDTNRDDYRLPTGNSYGQDHGFIYFGTFVGGYALKPLLGNIHVLTGGLAFSPFSWTKIYAFKNMSFYLKYHYYLKHQVQAAINYGIDATKPERNIGQGFDASLRWGIFQDFGVFVNYGIFVPGKAYGYYYSIAYRTVTYSSSSKRHFVMAGCNVSF